MSNVHFEIPDLAFPPMTTTIQLDAPTCGSLVVALKAGTFQIRTCRTLSPLGYKAFFHVHDRAGVESLLTLLGWEPMTICDGFMATSYLNGDAWAITQGVTTETVRDIRVPRPGQERVHAWGDLPDRDLCDIARVLGLPRDWR